MKGLTVSAIRVLVLALLIGMAFVWIYPHVELGAALCGLFVFVAVILERIAAWLWSLRRKSREPADTGAGK